MADRAAKLCWVVHELVVAASDRVEFGDDRIGASVLQLAVSRVGRQDLISAEAGQRREDLGEVRQTGLAFGVVAHLVVTVGHGSANLAADHVYGVEHPDHARRVVGRGLAHLLRRIGKVAHPGSDHSGREGWNGERVAVGGVEPLGKVTGELYVLGLIPTDWNVFGVVEQDVGCHQTRIGEQRRAGSGTPALLLELDHSAQLADMCCRLEQVAELDMSPHVGLYEHGRAIRVEPSRKEQSRRGQGQLTQPQGIVLGGKRVKVGDEVEAVVLLDTETAQRAEIVAEC